MAEKAGAASYHGVEQIKGLFGPLVSLGVKLKNLGTLIAGFWTNADKRVGKNLRYWR